MTAADHRATVLVHLAETTDGPQVVTVDRMAADHPELDASAWSALLTEMARPDGDGAQLLYRVRPDPLAADLYALAPLGWAAARRLTKTEEVA